MNWNKISEKSPQINKPVLLTSSYEGWETLVYVVGYLDKDQTFKVEREGLTCYNDIELNFEPTHWCVITPPTFH